MRHIDPLPPIDLFCSCIIDWNKSQSKVKPAFFLFVGKMQNRDSGDKPLKPEFSHSNSFPKSSHAAAVIGYVYVCLVLISSTIRQQHRWIEILKNKTKTTQESKSDWLGCYIEASQSVKLFKMSGYVSDRSRKLWKYSHYRQKISCLIIVTHIYRIKQDNTKPKQSWEIVEIGLF